MLINNYENKCTSDNIAIFVSDHLPQFLIIESVKDKLCNIKISKQSARDYKSCNKKSFQSDIKSASTDI